MTRTRLSLRPMAAAIACFVAVAGAAAAGGGAAPVLNGDHFVYSDGTRVRAADPSGRTGTASRDGTIRYSDGTSVSHDVSSGESKITHPDGRVDVSGGRGPTRGTDGNFHYSDGATLRGTDPSGNAGKINPDGTVSYSDGTRASHDPLSGDTKFVGPDGSVRLINPATGTDKTTPAGSAGVGGLPGQRGPGESTGKGAGKDFGKGLDGFGKGNSNTGSRDTSGRQNTGGKTTGANNTAPHDTSKDNSNKDSGKDNSGKGEKSSEKAEKPAKEGGGGKDKGRTVQDDQPSTGRGSAPIKVGGTTENKTGDETSGGTTTMLKPGQRFGPGGRTSGEPAVAGAGHMLTLPAGTLVTNPNPVSSGGTGTPKVIDAFGGRR